MEKSTKFCMAMESELAIGALQKQKELFEHFKLKMQTHRLTKAEA